MVLWDVPGGSTTAHPTEGYFERQCLAESDLLILIYTGRWTELCTMIAEMAFIANVEMIMVSTNMGNMVRNQMDKEEEEEDEAEQMVREQVQKNVEMELAKRNLPKQEVLFVESNSLRDDGPMGAKCVIFLRLVLVLVHVRFLCWLCLARFLSCLVCVHLFCVLRFAFCQHTV